MDTLSHPRHARTELKFGSPDIPAPDIETLVKYLKSIEPVSGTVAYRGQTREFQTLLPSGLRDFVDERDPRPWSQPDPGSVPPGVTFTPICYALDVVEFTAALLKKHVWPSIAEYEPLRFESNSSPFEISTNEIDVAVRVLAQAGLAGDIPPSLHRPESLHKDGVINQVIRRLIGDNAAATPFGVIPGLGSFLCQQYGLTSGFLDCTLSVDVAAFFATHDGPEYLIPVTRNGEIGVIYRFDIGDDDSQQYDTAQIPRVLRYTDIFPGLEDPHLTHRAAREAINLFVTDYGAFGERRVELLKVPAGSIAFSRVGRQQSVMLAPRLIRGARNGHDVSHLVWAEDLRSRPGFHAFYFQHRDNCCSYLHRNWLWPGVCDVFRTWLMIWLTGESPTYTGKTKHGVWLTLTPKRPDLIDCGYEFIVGCKPNMHLAVHDRATPHEDAHKEYDAKLARIHAIDQTTCEIPDCVTKTYIGLKRTSAIRLADFVTGSRYIEHAGRSTAFLVEIIDSTRSSDFPLKPIACYAMGKLVHKGGALWNNGAATAEAAKFMLSAAALSDFLDVSYYAVRVLVALLAAVVSDIEWMTDWTAAERVAWSVRCLDLLDEVWDVAARVPVSSDERKIELMSDVAKTIALRHAIIKVLRTTDQVPVPRSRLGKGWRRFFRLLLSLRARDVPSG